MKHIIVVIIALGLVALQAESKWSHEFSADTSKELSGAIKDKILANLDKFTNATFAAILKSDLNQQDDSKRGLKEIDEASAGQLFKLFNIKNQCTYVKGFLSGENLKCLNNIWKTYVPPN